SLSKEPPSLLLSTADQPPTVRATPPNFLSCATTSSDATGRAAPLLRRFARWHSSHLQRRQPRRHGNGDGAGQFRERFFEQVCRSRQSAGGDANCERLPKQYS